MCIPRCSLLFILLNLAGCKDDAPSTIPSSPSLPDPSDPACTTVAEQLAPVAFSWDGAAGTCDPSTPPDALAAATLSRTNLVRAAAGVAPIRLMDGTDAQRCALVLTANDSLAHAPEPDWTCLRPDPTAVLARSLTSDRSGLDHYQAYLIDPQNRQTLGHRRWLLSPWIDAIGVGATDDKACVDLSVASGLRTDDWIAWPPPGDTALAFLELAQYSTDSEGWMVMSDTVDFEGASVRIALPNRVIETDAAPLTPGFGSTYALGFVPLERVPVGVQWTVTIDGLDTPISYSGRKVDCGVDTP